MHRDPLEWWGAQAPEWSDAWLTATNWWTGALRDGQADSSERLLAEIVEGLSHRFRGRRFAFDLGGRRLRGMLSWVRLDRGDGDYAVHLELTDVEWDGVEFEHLAVSIGSVTLTAPPDVTLTASAIEIDGRAPVAPLVAWLDGRVPNWRLSVVEDSLVEAARPTGRWRFVVEPAVVEGQGVGELRAVRWRSAHLRIPTWLRLTRRLTLPPLPAGVVIVDATRHGSLIDSRMHAAVLRRKLELGDIRDAIAKGTR